MAEVVKLGPLGDRVIVRPEEERMVGRIHLPDSSRKKTLVGVVVDVGPHCTWVEVGDKVLYGNFSGMDLPLRGKYSDCLLMNEGDTLAKVEAEKEVENG